MKVRLRRFQAVESENVLEKVYDIIKRDLGKKKNKVGWGFYCGTDAHPNKHNANFKE